jgi:polyferredoxin
MALLGRLRRFDWLARRTECGKPCQRCRKDCTYQAINKDGRIDYEECFQCLDCVAIYESDQLCVPLIAHGRRSNRKLVIPIVPQAAVRPVAQGDV